MSDSLHPHGLEHARLSHPSPSPGACSNSCPLSQWCHPTISSSVIPFSSCPQSFPASGSFPASQFFTSGSQSIGASATVLLMNIQDWFPLGWTGLIPLQSKGFSRVLSNTTVQKYQFFGVQPSLWSNSHIHRWLSTQNENISFILLVIPSWPLPPKLITFLVMVSATQANHFFSYCFPRTWELNPPFYLYHFFWGKHPYGSVRVSLKNRKRLNVPFADVAHFLVLWFDGTWCGLI